MALVITIVILLILVLVSIIVLIKIGIISSSELTKSKYKGAVKKEENDLNKMSEYISENREIILKKEEKCFVKRI